MFAVKQMLMEGWEYIINVYLAFIDSDKPMIVLEEKKFPVN